MGFREKLTEVLKELGRERSLKDFDVEIQPSGLGKFVAIVRSESFNEIPEHLRQDLVWAKVIRRLDDDEQRSVEFIHTPAPSEETADNGTVASGNASTKRRGDGKSRRR
jgi:hypothetical protein